MSEEIAVSDNATRDDAPALTDGATEDAVAETVEAPPDQQIEDPAVPLEEPPAIPEGNLKLWHITYYLIC